MTKPAAVIALPANGHIALQLRLGGHKVFDLGKSVVVTLLPPELETKVVKEKMAKNRKIGKYSFAPALHRGCADEGWYEEAYINGTKSPNIYQDWDIAYNNFVPLIEAMILATPPRVVDLQDYVAQRRTACSRSSGSFASLLSPEQRTSIGDFVGQMSDRVLSNAVGAIGLSPSHGDLAAVNVMVTSGGLVAIDWDTFDFRSALHDLHFIFLMMLERPKRPETAEVVAKMTEAVAHLRLSIASRDPAVAATVFPADMADDGYRWLFYLEHTCMILGEFERTADQPAKKMRLAQLLTHIRIFDEVEEVILAKGLSLPTPAQHLLEAQLS